jgi:hypothetical protein
MHWSECLGVQILRHDEPLTSQVLYLEHGVNFGGTLNLFGGVDLKLVDRLEALANYTGELVSLDVPMPGYADQLSKRIGQNTCSSRLTKDLIAALDSRLKNSTTLTQADLKRSNVTIGDSHSTAFAPKDSSVLRTNGLTLHGALARGHFVEQIDRLVHAPTRLTLVCGSIDIRHHIGRQARPEQAIQDLCDTYSDLVDFLVSEFGIEVEVAAPVPVEWEGRKIPKTGFYKDSPFSGTLAQRQEWTQLFIDKMGCHSVVSPPSEWYTMDPEIYADTYMELNSSVHIAPLFYRRFDWGSL